MSLTSTTHGFSSAPSIISSTPQSLLSTQESALVLFGRNSKKGRLGSLVEEGGTVSPPKSRSSSSSSTTKKTKSKGSDTGSIAPGLAEWMAQQEGGETQASVSDEVVETKAKKSSERREKQNVRKELEEERNAKIETAITALEAALEQNGNLDGILSAVRGLMQLGDDSSSLKTLLAAKKRSDYRLAWVGGDDAICHLGTGLHKVPLARLQEVFLSCMGRNRIEVSEVIRILGPFPNVRNILQGSTKIGAPKNGVETMNIVMDSMVDGTGKEILAGTEDNIRRVNLQIYFSDEKAIVAVVPPETTDGGSPVRSDPLENNGAHVLVFVREEDLDEKLDSLRVS